jgi:hypothetical protein
MRAAISYSPLVQNERWAIVPAGRKITAQPSEKISRSLLSASHVPGKTAVNCDLIIRGVEDLPALKWEF